MGHHQVVSAAEWLKARRSLLQKEKEFTHAREALSQARRELPWQRVEKSYEFTGPNGQESLSSLFGKRSQLVVYHFMFAPEWEAGCRGCSFWADSFDRAAVHLAARDVSFVAVSRAPLAKLQAFQARMGWSFKWVSSGNNDFNYDYQVSFDSARPETATYNYAPKTSAMTDLPGTSVFYRDEQGNVFHTYSAYARGIDALNVAYQYLDLVPKGRDEDALDSTQAWVRLRDQYDAAE